MLTEVTDTASAEPRRRDLLGWRPVRAAAQTLTRALRLALVLVAALAVLLGTSGAHADESGTEELQAVGDDLAAKSRSVVLELYALDSQLGRVQARLAQLDAQADEVSRERQSAERHLALVRSMLADAEIRLAERIHQLYTEDDPDPVTVLLGAQSLDEAISNLENLGRFAHQDRRIIARVEAARREVKGALAEVAEREAELAALRQEAAASESALLSARGERESYLASLRAEQRLNAAQVAAAQEAAAAAEVTTVEVEAETAAAPSPAPAPASVPDAPAGPGTQITVVATGYALNGTTATGIPVGWGVVAVDPSVIPLGTRMTIPGYGEGVAADTGGAVQGNTIDLWFPTTAEALAWGRRTVTIALH